MLVKAASKVAGLEGYGLEIVEWVPVVVKPNPHNARYMREKAESGHQNLQDIFPPNDFPPEGEEYRDEG